MGFCRVVGVGTQDQGSNEFDAEFVRDALAR